MAKCATCGKRKAKRSCPARRASLCPACCGRLRSRERTCPPTCRHLAEHAPYQERRVLERTARPPAGGFSAPDDPLKDERLAWLAVNAEAPLADLGSRIPEFTDGDAVLALESAKEKIEKGRGLIVLPGADRRTENAAGEAVFQSLERSRFEKSVLLSAESTGYTAEEKIRVLDRLVAYAKAAAGGNIGGRAYLESIIASFAEMKKSAAEPKILAAR
jgi:hypothetical protein